MISWQHVYGNCLSSGAASSREAAQPWILTPTALAIVGLVLACASGCTRTVLVNPGSPVRIGPEASAHVYALVDGEWRLSSSRVALPEGWYLVDPSFVEADE